MFVLITFLNKKFKNIVIAKLPFEPFRFVRGITHRGLTGDDYTDCSFIFIYIITGIVLRTNI